MQSLQSLRILSTMTTSHTNLAHRLRAERKAGLRTGVSFGKRIVTILALMLGSMVLSHGAWLGNGTAEYSADSVALLQANIAAGIPGFQVGDIISVEAEFPTIAEGTSSGPGGYITAYVPGGVQVVGAEIIDPVTGDPVPARDATSSVTGEGISKGWGPKGEYVFTTGPDGWDPTILPLECTLNGLTAADCNGGLAYVYGDTGIFYSSRADTALYTGDGSNIVSLNNGYEIDPTNSKPWGTVGGTGNARVHNKWDAVQSNAFGTKGAIPNPGFTTAEETQINPDGRGTVPYNVGSPVAGPDAGYTYDRYGDAGPWQRIAYEVGGVGSCRADDSSLVGKDGPANDAGSVYPEPVADVNSVAVCTRTGLGYALSETQPLPSGPAGVGANAVRFAVGGIHEGQSYRVRMTMRVTDPSALETINFEGSGGDSTEGASSGNDNPWRYWVGGIAWSIQPATLHIEKEIVAVDGLPYDGVSPISYLSTVTYRITYVNTWVQAQTNVQLSDTLPNQVLSLGTINVVSGPDVLPISPSNPAPGSTFNFAPIPELGPGYGGIIEVDVVMGGNDGDNAVNTASIVSNEAAQVSDSAAAAIVVPTYELSGRVFDDVNYGGGAGRDYTVANTAAIASGFVDGAVLRDGTTVELYDASTNLLVATTTTVGGQYVFNTRRGDYYIRVVNDTVTSLRGGGGGERAVQTYRTDVSTGVPLPVIGEVGGAVPSGQDAPAQTLGTDLSTITAQSVTVVSLVDTAISGIDFGFNFDTIVNSNSSGQGSLAQFIANSNSLSNVNLDQAGLSAGDETSIFMIPGSDPNYDALRGVAQLPLSSQLPAITDGNTVIDGGTQTTHQGDNNPGLLGTGGVVGLGPDYRPDTGDEVSLPQVARPEIEIVDGANLSLGLDIQADNTTVRGLSIYGFGSSSADGNIRVGSNALSVYSGTLIEQNVLGSPADSLSDPGLASGANLVVYGADGGTVQNNLIAYAGSSGMVLSSSADNWTVTANEIRGNGTLDSTQDGLSIASGSSNAVTANLISANRGSGLEVLQGANNTLSDNTVSANGQGGVQTPGVRLVSSDNTVLGNRIHQNVGPGILVLGQQTGLSQTPALQNRISQNSFKDNGGVGIDLGASGTDPNTGDGQTANDGVLLPPPLAATVTDCGFNNSSGNRGIDYPTILTAEIGVAGETVVAGTACIDQVDLGNFPLTVELYQAAEDGSGFGEGEIFLQAATVDAASGAWAITVPSGDLQGGDTVTTILIDKYGNTSEFSGNVYVTDGDVDLSVTKTADKTSPPELSQVVYTVQVDNAGPDNATGVEVTDNLPAGLSFVKTTGCLNDTDGVPVCELGDIPSGGSASYTITAYVNSGTQGTVITNTATASTVAQRDTNAANDSGSVNIIPAAPVTGGPRFICDGTYYLSQGSPTQLKYVDVTTTPFTLNNVGTTSESYNSIGFNVLDGYIYGINSSSKEVYRISADGSVVSLGTPDGIPDKNFFAGDVDENGVYMVYNGGTLVKIDVLTDVASVISITNTSLSPGVADIAYNPIDGKLYGYWTSTAQERVIYIDPDSGFVNPFGTPQSPGLGTMGATYFDGFGNFYGYQNSPGAFYRFDVGVNGSGTGNATQLSTGPNVSTNDGASCPVAPRIEKTVSPKQTYPGDTVTYSFSLVNPNGYSLSGLSLSDTMANGRTFVDGTLTISPAIPEATVNAYGSSSTLDITDLKLEAKTTYTVTVDVLVPLSAPVGTVYNQASVDNIPLALGGPSLLSDDPSTGASPDPTALEILSPSADLVMSKSVDNGTPDEGDTIVYTLTVTNAGPATAQSVSVTDLLPAGITYVSDDGGGSYVPGSGQWTIGSLSTQAGSNTAALNITATVDAGTGNSTITNTATVSSATGDPNAANDSASADTAVPPPGVDVSGTVYHDLQPNFLFDAGENWVDGIAVFVNLIESGTVVNSVSLSPGSGDYLFSAVPRGDYSVVVTDSATNTVSVRPADWIFISPDNGSRSFKVEALNISNQTFGLFNGSSITGTVFFDDGRSAGTANDAFQNGAEPGISGVVVTASDGTVSASASTDPAGDYTLWVPASAGPALTLSHTKVQATGTSVAGAGAVQATGFDDPAASQHTLSGFVSGTSYNDYDFGVVNVSSFGPDQSGQTGSPGTIDYQHWYRPGTQGTVTVSLGMGDWSYGLFVDETCDGQFDASEGPHALPYTFTVDDSWARGASGSFTECQMQVRVIVPGGEPDGAVDIGMLEARLQWQNNASVSESRQVIDTTQVVSLGNLSLEKAVRNISQGETVYGTTGQGKPGEILEYCIGYRNLGVDAVTDMRVSDPAPFFTEPQTGSYGGAAILWTHDGTSQTLTAASGDDAGSISQGIVAVEVGSLGPGISGQVCYQAQID